MITEGSRVVYAGDDPFNQSGSTGKVISLSGRAAHVQWNDGPKKGSIDLVEQFELIPTGMALTATVSQSFDNSLEMMSPPLQVRAAYDEGGEDGLMVALEEAGKIAVLADYGDEAGQHLAARIRQNPEFAQVLAELDPDEANSLVTRVSYLVLMDWVSGGEG